MPVYGDTLAEISESFYIQLSDSKGATIADGTGVVTILDTTPRMSISTHRLRRGRDDLHGHPLGTVPDVFTVNYTTGDYEAFAGQDYVATSGTLTFAPARRRRPSRCNLGQRR